MKILKLHKNEYFWNEFFDFIFLAVEYPKRKKEIIYKPGSQRYEDLSSHHGWRKLDSVFHSIMGGK